jgi:predicted nucleic acid-binding protein
MRYGIDAPTAVRLVREGIQPSHQLVAPSVLRSDAMALLYAQVTRGSTPEKDARELLERLASLKVRVLGDRVSRATAWELARQHGWDDPSEAEYIAVTKLQADALVTLDPELRRRAHGLVELADYAALMG